MTRLGEYAYGKLRQLGGSEGVSAECLLPSGLLAAEYFLRKRTDKMLAAFASRAGNALCCCPPFFIFRCFSVMTDRPFRPAPLMLIVSLPITSFEAFCSQRAIAWSSSSSSPRVSGLALNQLGGGDCHHSPRVHLSKIWLEQETSPPPQQETVTSDKIEG